MVREVPVHLEEQLGHVAVQLFKQPVQGIPARAIAGIEHDLNSALEIELLRDFIHVRRLDVIVRQHAFAMQKVAPGDHPVELLNRRAVNGSRAANGLESVIFFRIVAARDHHAARGLQVDGRIVEQRSRHPADVSNVASRGQ